MQLLAIDFEYRKSHNREMDLVCVSFTDGKNSPQTLWLNKSAANHVILREYLTSLQSSHIILCFNASAEARAFLSLGLNPRDFMWIDLNAEWKIATNNNTKFMYGKILKQNGFVIESFPLAVTNKDPENPVSHEKVGKSLSAMVLKLLNVNIDTRNKSQMRDLILNNCEWTQQEREKILAYCESDIKYLHQCVELLPQYSDVDFERGALWRGRSSVNMAVCENHGFPLDLDAIFSFAANCDSVKQEAVVACNKVYPFFVAQRKTKKSPLEYVQSYEQLHLFVKSKKLENSWPRTNNLNSKLKCDEETLEKYRGLPEISALKGTLKILQQIKWFRPAALPEFLSRVGDDHRLRPYLNPYGTATGRNAPPAKTFILAMSSWMRYLVQPENGQAITGMDYSSQEFAIAAALANDSEMIRAYNSGDPYLAFAKLAAAVPQSATRETHGVQRDLFKATVLASQFGMGEESLSFKISADTGKPPDLYQARDLLRMHREVFWRYYDWLQKVEREYRAKGRIQLHDGHILWFANEREKNILSVRNHPVQGTGSVIMRYAIDLALERGIKVLSPLHDAIYHEHSMEETDEKNTILESVMDEAVDRVFGGKIKIRHEKKTVTRLDPWIEPKGKKDLETMKQFLVSDDGLLLKMALFDGRK